MRDLPVGRFLLLFVGISLFANPVQAKIEAVKGKEYHLSKAHGPWMIMVASLAEPPAERRKEGISPQEAANQLVYDLRKKGIPAYTYSQKEVRNHVKSYDRLGRERERSYLAQNDRICVIAGNYNSVDDKVGQQTLAYIKKLQPKSWEQHGNYKKTPGRPGPLSGAFLTINPKLSPDEVMQRKHDPLLLKLNSGSDMSLLTNTGKYTLVVASFYGRSQTQAGFSQISEAMQNFKVTDSLDEAAMSAWRLAGILRERQEMRSMNMKSYVFHDRYKSIVTLGEFDSPTDPRIPKLIEIFRAKTRRNPENGQTILTAEIITIPGDTPRSPPQQSFIFDPQPKLMEVPKLY